jgi:hypothetical protein
MVIISGKNQLKLYNRVKKPTFCINLGLIPQNVVRTPQNMVICTNFCQALAQRAKHWPQDCTSTWFWRTYHGTSPLNVLWWLWTTPFSTDLWSHYRMQPWVGAKPHPPPFPPHYNMKHLYNKVGYVLINNIVARW